MIGYFNLVNNLNNYVNYYFIIIIVPEKPLMGRFNTVCMYVIALVSSEETNVCDQLRFMSCFHGGKLHHVFTFIMILNLIVA